MSEDPPQRTARKGRGALNDPDVRFEAWTRVAIDDGWGSLDEPPPPLTTTVGIDRPRRVIAWNQSPDLPFDRSLNPYRGCEHGCIYCYARPDHARIGLSPGQDFESRLLYKADAASRLEEELRRPGYEPASINLGANTDPYQPIERDYRVTRSLLAVLAEFRHPVTIVTKGALIERDVDLLQELARYDAVAVMVSLTSLDRGLKRRLEPRAAAPRRRLQVIERLSAAGIPCGTLIAPVIPALTDHELEQLVSAAGDAGARSAGYVLLRLPREVRPLFEDWLHHHYPDRAERVLSRLRACHAGAAYDPQFGRRMQGTGPWAALLAQRFRQACHRAGIAPARRITPSSAHFQAPPRAGDQGELFPESPAPHR